jgi:hypothetical protein
MRLAAACSRTICPEASVVAGALTRRLYSGQRYLPPEWLAQREERRKTDPD